MGKCIEAKCRLLIARGWRMEETGSNCLKGPGLPFGSGEALLELEVIVVQHWEYTKCNWIVTFKMVNLMFYGFKLN